MEFENNFDLLLEAMAYFGRRAAGKSWNEMEQRIAQQKMIPSTSFIEVLEQLKALTNLLNKNCLFETDKVETLFGNLEGFPYNTIGSSSRAFFVLYPMLKKYQGNPKKFVKEICAMPREEIAWGIASIFEDDLPASHRLELGEFTDLVLGLSTPDSTKVALLELSKEYVQVAKEAMECLISALKILETHKNLLQKAIEPFASHCKTMSQSDFFAQFSLMRPDPDTVYTIQPFVFGADTNLTFGVGSAQVHFYGGILRMELMELVNGRTSAQNQVCEIYRLLGDSTRFDIFCYLRNHTAYVQDLSSRFGLSRNTIHHHMNKLIDCGLVQCTVKGNRMYYSLNKKTVEQFLQRQAFLFQKEER